jgi:hypothetical protein
LGATAELPTETFFVGYGDSAAIVDHIGFVELGSSHVDAPSRNRDGVTEVVAKIRHRAAQQQTGYPLVLSLDRRLLLPANADRRKMVEEAIRALHGTMLHDGRIVHVEEVLGRYGDQLDGTPGQLNDISGRLRHGQPVRMAIGPAGLTDETCRQLGALKHRFGNQLQLCAHGRPDQRTEVRTRLAREASRAHLGAVGRRLLAGESVVLGVPSQDWLQRHRRELSALKRKFGAQLRIEIDRFPRPPRERPAKAAQPTTRTADVEPMPAEPLAPLQVPPASDLSPLAPSDEDQTQWAREVAQRVRAPWWRRTKWFKKFSGGPRNS